MDDSRRGFTAQLFDIPQTKDDPHNALHTPVYHSVAFGFDSAEAMEEAFTGRCGEHTYSRITNPTVEHFEQRVQTLTGAIGVTAVNSGMAAIAGTFLTLAKAGDNVVLSPYLFGNTYSLFRNTLAAFGLEPRFCDTTDLKAVGEQIDGNTCAIFLEIITNPQQVVTDLTALSALCQKHGIPLIADTTIIPFQAFDARSFGVDIAVVSSTKYISGGATSLGGLIVDYGSFDWSRSAKLKAVTGQCTKPQEAFGFKLRREVCRNLGIYMTPQTAQAQSLGLETLEVRYARMAATTGTLAHELGKLDGIESVHYTGLPDNPYYIVSRRQFGENPGAMLTFDLASQEACYRFLNRLQHIRRATNLFDNKTLAIHPWSTIYGTFDEKTRLGLGVSPKTIRLSVGLEEAEDLLADIRQALG